MGGRARGVRGGGESLAGSTAAGPLSYATGVGVRCDDAEGVFWVARRRPVREGLRAKKMTPTAGRSGACVLEWRRARGVCVRTRARCTRTCPCMKYVKPLHVSNTHSPRSTTKPTT